LLTTTKKVFNRTFCWAKGLAFILVITFSCFRIRACFSSSCRESRNSVDRFDASFETSGSELRHEWRWKIWK
jgi:hypothetical protein